ncbi:MAG: helix-turn-helix domain-containing protein [Acidobacteriota bacterium]
MRRDRERVGARLKPLLEHIEASLFDPGLDVNQLKRACGVRDNTIPIQFHAELGMPPHAYIEDCRLKTACRLLCDTDLKVWQIADLLGYSSIQVFSRAFSRWAGVRPTVYRKRERRNEETAPSPLPEVPTLRVETLRQALRGDLDAAGVESLMRRLLALYPASSRRIALEASSLAARAESVRRPSQRHSPVRSSLDKERVERVRAEEVWREMEGRSWEERRELVRRKLRFTTAALFELIHDQAIEIGRQDRQEGLRLAELALESLETIDPEAVDAEDRANLDARAWAWLGNARRIVLDFTGAEEALSEAERRLSVRRPDVIVQADIFKIKAALRWFQRRLHEAMALINEAIVLYRRADKSHLLGQAMVVRALLLLLQDKPDESLPVLARAMELIDRESEPWAFLSAHQVLIAAYTFAGRYEDAESSLLDGHSMAREVDNRDAELRLRWLEGLVAREKGSLDRAEDHLKPVVEELTAAEQTYDAALASLDLALVYSAQGRDNEVIALAGEMIPVFGALRVHREGMAALNLIQAAIKNRQITIASLWEARRLVDRSRGLAMPWALPLRVAEQARPAA